MAAATVYTDMAFFTGATGGSTSNCDAITDWGGSTPTTDTGAFIEGTSCNSLKVSNTTSAALVFAISGTKDMTGLNMYIWIAGTKKDQWDTQANGGIRMRVDDGTRYSEWFVAGNDTIANQGWLPFACNFGDLLGAAVAYVQGTTTYTTETTGANNATTNDMTLFPAVGSQSTNDAYYFGHKYQFRELLVNIGTAGAGTYTVTWQYWNGSSWANLSGVTDNTNAFKATAGAFEYTVKFTKPTDWYTTTVNSISNLYWVRVVLDVSGGKTYTTAPKGTRAWVRFGATPNRAGVVATDTNDGIEANYSAVTHAGIRLKTVQTNSRINCWWDALRYGTYLGVKAGTSPDPAGNFSTLLAAESSNAYGLILPVEGVLDVQGILQFGSTTSTDATVFSDTNYHIRFRKTLLGNPANGIKVVGNAGAGGTTSVQLGSYSSGVTSGGLLVDTNDTTNNRWILDCTDTNQTTIKFYGTKFYGASSIWFGNAGTKMDNIELVNNKFEANDTIQFNLDSTETTSLNQENSFSNSNTTNAVELYEIGNWKLQTLAGNSRALAVMTTTITFTLKTTTFATNTTDVYFWHPSGTSTVNLIDSTDNAVVSQSGSLSWNVYEKTTYDLNLKDEGNNAIVTAGVRLADTNGTEQFAGTTNASGNITQQQIVRRSRVCTGSLATTTHNPYQLRMRRDGHVPQQIGGKSYGATAVSDSFVLLNDDNFVHTASTVSLQFKDNSPSADSIERTSGSFVTDGWVAGQKVRVSGSTSNNGSYLIGSVTALVITLDAAETLTNEGPATGRRLVLDPSNMTGVTIGETAALAGAVADDGGVQTDETTAANNGTANDMTLLPAVPAVNDAYYFGGANKFAKLVINIGTAGAGTWALTWEYYNGSWTAITVTDGTSNFKPSSTGNKNVTWTMPSDWASTSIASISAYWIRARVSSYTSVTTQPKGTQAFLAEQIQVTVAHTLLQVYEYLRYHTRLTANTDLSDALTSADGVTFQNSDYDFKVSGVDLSGSSLILSMPTHDFFLISGGTQGLKKLTDIDGTQVSLQLTNVITNSRCYIIDTSATSKNISSISATGGAVSITTSSAHGLSVGHLFQVGGTVGFNGTYTVATAPTTTTLTTTETHSTLSESTGTLIRILMNKNAASSTVTQAYVHTGDATITVRVRKSSAATKYLPYETGGTVTSDGFSAYISQVADSIAQ